MKFGWWLARSIIVLILKTLTSTSTQGLEKIYNIKGKAIVATNHLGALDVWYAFWLVKRSDIIMVIAGKHRRQPFVGWLAKQLDILWFDRDETDLSTMKEILRRLDRGGILFLAPEGTRSKTEALLEGKPGIAYLGSKSQAPIVPASLCGTEDRLVKDNLRHLRRSPVKILVGEPFTLPPLPRQNKDEFLRQQTDEVMTRIAALLPEKYRGVYAKHPRLRELLATG